MYPRPRYFGHHFTDGLEGMNRLSVVQTGAGSVVAHQSAIRGCVRDCHRVTALASGVWASRSTAAIGLADQRA
jgi:hypothetical protein